MKIKSKNSFRHCLDYLDRLFRDPRFSAVTVVPSLVATAFTVLKDKLEDAKIELGLAPDIAIAIVAATWLLGMVVIVLRPLPAGDKNDVGTAPASASDSTAAPSVAASRVLLILGVVLALFLSWIVYSLIWVILALAMQYSARLVVSFLFFMLGALVVLGILITRMPVVGGFLGGAIPLGTLTLYYVSTNPEMASMVGANNLPISSLAWFSLFAIIGGCFGTVTALIVITVMRFSRLPIS